MTRLAAPLGRHWCPTSRRGGIALARGNSASQTIHALTALLGPPLAGVLIVRYGASNVLWLDAATFAVSAAVVSLAVPHVAVAARGSASSVEDVREGFRFLRNHRLLRSITLMALTLFFIPALRDLDDPPGQRRPSS